MKKVLIILALVCASVFCFANDDEIDSHQKNGLSVMIGDMFYHSSNYHADSNSFDFAIGFWQSDEDGLFDITESYYLGFNKGQIFNDGLNYQYPDTNIIFTQNTKYHNVFIKESFGLQANLLCFSFGAMFGTKVGVEWLNSYGYAQVYNCNYSMTEFNIYADFVPVVYCSLNLFNFMKISLLVDFELPFIKCRFITDEFIKNGNSMLAYEPVIDWKFFNGDVPVTYSVALTLFF